MAHQASTITIETATPNDCAVIAIMNRQLIDDEGNGNTMTVLELENRMRDWLQHGIYTGYLFKLNDETIGYALVDLSDMWMRHFFICRECRRLGYGRKAIGLLFEKLKVEEIGLSCLMNNAPGLAFWRGFSHKAYSLQFNIRKPTDEMNIAEPVQQQVNVTIREIEKRDYADVLAIWNSEIGSGYLTSENFGPHHDRFKEDENYKAFVAELDGKVVGFIYIMQYMAWGLAGGNIWIQCLAVKADMQNKGIGTQMLEHIENYGREKSIEYITLNTGYKRTAAHSFYQRNGYSSGNWCFGKKL